MAGKKGTFKDILRESFPVNLNDFLETSDQPEKRTEPKKSPIAKLAVSNIATVSDSDTVSLPDTVATSDTVSSLDTVSDLDTVITPHKVEIVSNYFLMDKDIFDLLPKFQTLAEQAIYRYLYRLSYGCQSQECFVGLKSLIETCNMSKNTVRDALKGLEQKGHIKRLERMNVKETKGTTYRVFLPCEISGIQSQTQFRVIEE